MKALVQLHNGFSSERGGFDLDALAPYLELAEIPVPTPGEDQALIKVAAASVNPSDVAFIKGQYGQPRRKGVPAGFEGVGEVVDGKGTAFGPLGKRVAFMGSVSGAWAEYAMAEAAYCIPLMDGIRDEDGAAMIVNPMTALAMVGMVRAEGQPAFILTAGASQLCKLIIRHAKEEGYRPIAIVRREEQVDLLKGLGAAHVLNEKADDFTSQLAAVLKEEKPRILFDAVTGALASTVFDLMGRGARWIIYGRLDETPPAIREPGQFIFMNKRIEGFWLSRWLREAAPDERSRAALSVQQQFKYGVWSTDVTARLSLEEAYDRLPEELAKPNGKVFIAP